VSVAQKAHGRHQPNPNYPANVREYARRLAKENGWSPYRVRKAMTGRVDPLPSEHAIRTWVDKDYYEDHLRKARTYGPAGPARKKTWARRLARMEELRNEAKLTYASIAKLMAHDFGLSIGKEQTERILKGMVSGKTIRRVLSPREAA
jgi:hypothetical protein